MFQEKLVKFLNISIQFTGFLSVHRHIMLFYMMSFDMQINNLNIFFSYPCLLELCILFIYIIYIALHAYDLLLVNLKKYFQINIS